MARNKSYSTIYSAQRTILLVFYLSTMIALCIPLVLLVTRLSPGNYFPLVITLLFYLVLVSVIGSFIYVVSYIPFNLASAFDPIKNDIASGRITDLEQFGKRITGFVTEFFNFSFLDIAHAFFQTPGSDLISHGDLSPVEKAMEEYKMLEKSSKLEEIMRAGKVSLHNREYHLYILPIWINDRWLGYMGLLTEKRISRFFQKFLVEFEDNFLDDQLLHIIQLSKQAD
ncbi:MAG TPA: hypothetical protein ENO20_12525 [Bacteroides sp.]|nr:hypothetical protein [Bacteroides sp.]